MFNGDKFIPPENGNKNVDDILPEEYYKQHYENIKPYYPQKKYKGSYILNSLLGAGIGILPGLLAATYASTKTKNKKAQLGVMGATVGLSTVLAALITHKYNSGVDKYNTSLTPTYELGVDPDSASFDDIYDFERYDYGKDPLRDINDNDLAKYWGLRRKKNA